jgi:hypothetical protein
MKDPDLKSFSIPTKNHWGRLRPGNPAMLSHDLRPGCRTYWGGYWGETGLKGKRKGVIAVITPS